MEMISCIAFICIIILIVIIRDGYYTNNKRARRTIGVSFFVFASRDDHIVISRKRVPI